MKLLHLFLHLYQAPDIVEGNRPDPRWPMNGEVVFDRYKTRYRPGLDLVIKGISANIKGGEKVNYSWLSMNSVSMNTISMNSAVLPHVLCSS